jgi:hypothetical protein
MGMMLSLLKKNICPLVSLALAFGCGKKINDPSTTDTSRTTQGQTTDLTASVTLQIDETVSADKSYKLPKNAWFNLPDSLSVIEGSAIGKRVKIYYNLLSTGDYEFSCFYKSLTAAKVLAFEKCENNYGKVIISSAADLVNVDFPMDKDTSIKMKLTNPSGTGLKIESRYIVDWK